MPLILLLIFMSGIMVIEPRMALIRLFNWQVHYPDDSRD